MRITCEGSLYYSIFLGKGTIEINEGEGNCEGPLVSPITTPITPYNMIHHTRDWTCQL